MSEKDNSKKKIAALTLGALVLPATIAAPACSFVKEPVPSDPSHVQNIAEVYGPVEPAESDIDDENGAGDGNTSNKNRFAEISVLYGPAQG